MSVVKYKGRRINLEPEGLVVDELTNENVRHVISRAPAQYAFYMSMAAEVTREMRTLEEMIDNKAAQLYNQFDQEKRTETWKKKQVELGMSESSKMKDRLLDLEALRAKLHAIAKAFDLQVKALQTVGGLVRTEMDMILNSETSPMEG